LTPHPRINPTIDSLVRREGARLTAALISFLGTQELALAEDVAQDALLSALQTWNPDDLPAHPRAWLRRVAMNRAIDALRRRQKEQDGSDLDLIAAPPELEEYAIPDPELRLLALSCHESLKSEDQVILSLNLGAGFTTRHIARLLLRQPEAVAQRLVRLKRILRAQPELTELPESDALRHREASILRVIYLMFCAGYLPVSGDKPIQLDIMQEATRLAESAAALFEDSADASALCALLCLQSSRWETRERDGSLLPLAEQNRSNWDHDLIRRGMAYLVASRNTSAPGRYHLEAAIAAEHATAASYAETNWLRIHELYVLLEQITLSPVVSVSTSIAAGNAGYPDQALAMLKQLEAHPALQHYPPFFSALEEAHRSLGNQAEADAAHHKASALQQNSAVRNFLDEKYLSAGTVQLV
jgi:RNA polymerase sigma-70 factor, ECF subfamily